MLTSCSGGRLCASNCCLSVVTSAEQALGNGRQAVEIALLEQCVFDAVEAAEGRILLAFFEVIGAGVDAVVQFGQALRGRGQTLISRARRYVQRLSLGSGRRPSIA